MAGQQAREDAARLGGPVEVGDDCLRSERLDRMREDGYALVMSTMLKGRPALRMVPIHPGAQAEEIRETIRLLTEAFEVLSAA